MLRLTLVGTHCGDLRCVKLFFFTPNKVYAAYSTHVDINDENGRLKLNLLCEDLLTLPNRGKNHTWPQL